LSLEKKTSSPETTMSEAFQRVFRVEPGDLAAGEEVTLDCRGMSQLTIITGAGCTATYSLVDNIREDDHDTATDDTVPANTLEVVSINWPFILLSAAGGPLRYALT
jgi:hypothetical protein